MADPTMEEMVAAVSDFGNLLDLRMCAQLIADSCLAWLTLGEGAEFRGNACLEVYRSMWYPESWDALCIIEKQLNISDLPHPYILRVWRREGDSGVRQRPEKGFRSTVVRDITLAEETQSISTVLDVCPARSDEKKGSNRAACDVVALATGLSYATGLS